MHKEQMEIIYYMSRFGYNGLDIVDVFKVKDISNMGTKRFKNLLKYFNSITPFQKDNRVEGFEMAYNVHLEHKDKTITQLRKIVNKNLENLKQ